MRIAVVAQKFGHVGGVATVARWLVDGLRARGLEVDVLELAESRSDVFSRRLTAPQTWRRRTLAGETLELGQQAWGANAVELEFMRYLPRKELTDELNGYDLVQVICGGPALATVARHVERPVAVQAATRVSWERASILARHSGLERKLRGAMTDAVARLEAPALRRADVAFLENWEMLRYTQSVGQRNAHFAPPGTDVERFFPADQRAGDGPLLSVCRLGEPRKGLENLIRAYGLLATRHATVPDLVLAGRGTLYPVAEQALQNSPVRHRITVLSDVPQDGLPELYRSAGVFVQGSFEEGLGLSSIEAMACGLPVAATATDGSRAAVADGETGYLCELGDADAIADGLSLAVEGCLQRGDELGEAARVRAVEMFSTEACLGNFIRHYEGVLTTTGGVR
ncbi:hypothetical protein CGZ94_15370 [Enemella evansiae]|uniref:Glycosyl transferase family 1 domain-containing protein n=1 Tax=Enemella evansiae TaxID=2016499 RepID=A0A255G8B0_9ACTN|nr:glycosyltransferase [Enemella evansiae]OYO11781.1 hypothetical protein CGZ94_15370 [Enemella evansiae]